MYFLPDQFQRLPKSDVDGIFFLAEPGIDKGDLPGKIGHEGNGEVPPDLFVDPLVNSRMSFLQRLADDDAGVAVFIHGGGKPEEAADERPERIMDAPFRNLFCGVEIQ